MFSTIPKLRYVRGHTYMPHVARRPHHHAPTSTILFIIFHESRGFLAKKSILRKFLWRSSIHRRLFRENTHAGWSRNPCSSLLVVIGRSSTARPSRSARFSEEKERGHTGEGGHVSALPRSHSPVNHRGRRPGHARVLLVSFSTLIVSPSLSLARRPPGYGPGAIPTSDARFMSPKKSLSIHPIKITTLNHVCHQLPLVSG